MQFPIRYSKKPKTTTQIQHSKIIRETCNNPKLDNHWINSTLIQQFPILYERKIKTFFGTKKEFQESPVSKTPLIKKRNS